MARVVTASAGNHAQAVAHHSARLGICATVVMPEFTPLIKVSNTKRYGARVIQTGATLSDGLKEVHRMVEEDKMNLVHASDGPEAATREIDLLNEYRTRLIADVVTGKLDVREAAAALPEVDPLAADEPDDFLDAATDENLDDLDATLGEAEA